jgi:hypothetical protein
VDLSVKERARRVVASYIYEGAHVSVCSRVRS